MDKIAIITARGKDLDFAVTSAAEKFFLNHGCSVSRDSITGCSLAVVVGGDGSILRASRETAPAGIPILGINLGRVGYMSELEASELDMAENIFTGKYTIEDRMMLSVCIIRSNGKIEHTVSALNDAVVSNGSVARMVDIELYCNGSHVNHYRADGLIISTPTGSTAYSLAAGGPVIDPKLDCICVTPVSSHLMYAKPIVFSSDSILKVIDNKQTRGELYLTVDGNDNFKLSEGDTIKIEKSPITTKLLRLKNNSFCDILNTKMSN